MKTFKDGAAIVVQVAAGLIAGVMLLGLLPGDSIEVNTVGALVIAALAGASYYGARAYRKNLHI